MVVEYLHQGDILRIEKIKHPVLVVSKDFFNMSGEIIGCPVISNTNPGPLHIWTSVGEEIEGYIQCEKLALLDLSIRGHKKLEEYPCLSWLMSQMLFREFLIMCSIYMTNDVLNS